jgi:S1-C subfamily serine protease
MGTASVALGVSVFVTLRIGRLFRAWPLLLLAAASAATGLPAATVGVFHWMMWSDGSGWNYQSMPELPQARQSPEAERIMRATAVILAPDGDGDASGISIGAGAVIRSEAGRAWVVTCSHVAMPYAAVASWRQADRSYPVWVYLSDGRQAVGHVAWTARPPLDVALVSIEIDQPPAAVPIARDAAFMASGSSVTFTPNPFRDGWLVHSGEVLTRESHDTPAGTYSLLHTDLPVQPGDSGSGLFDSDGQLIGLNTWVKASEEGPVGISLPSEVMLALSDLIERGDLESLRLSGGGDVP